MANQVITGIKETAQSITGAARPWGDFLDLSAFSFPSSIADATTRVTQNLTHFRINYSIILSILLGLTLITRPIAILAFIAVGLAWFFLYFAREEPLTIFGFTIDDGIVAVLLIGLSIGSLVSTGVWLRALTTVGFGVLVLILHAALRGTDDLVSDDLESPYGPMLSTAGGGNDGARGDYSGI
ncbi:Prenylated rab acceptor PRA1 [Arabidopsis suecica]|uniref:PRA1 family protein n=1 Tax=Arabidopsis suecica TaxID=45249 RepID=A0A8T2CBY4_ARASU|nr:Prenylated rab acceptor PRA1 [Arabidopsis suecica]